MKQYLTVRTRERISETQTAVALKRRAEEEPSFRNALMRAAQMVAVAEGLTMREQRFITKPRRRQRAA